MCHRTSLQSRNTPRYSTSSSGPYGTPFVGNLLDMPYFKAWIKYADWGDKYGDMCSVNILGQQITIINSAKIAFDLLDKKGSIYSDRPVIPLAGEMIGWKNTLVLMPYGDRFRNFRRLAHSLFGSRTSMASFEPLVEIESHRFLKRVDKTPDDFQDHIVKTAGAIILRISHGYRVKDEGADAFVTLANTAMEQFGQATAPGLFLVNSIPLLRYVPSWFPGAGFQHTAKFYKQTLMRMTDEPFEVVKQELANGTAQHSLLSALLDGKTLDVREEFDVKWLAASLHSVGADTTVSAIYAFFKAMVLFPECQAKAQAEIDAVVGSHRLPGFADKELLPYTAALAMEVHRWHTVGPTGMPHRLVADDVHNGYFLPKGSLVLTNIWKMTHDPRVYSNPWTFDPERFIAKEGKQPEMDPRDLMFGFGRRICPGRVLADASVWMTAAMSLAVFKIGRHPKYSHIDLDVTSGTISHPSHFKCSIEPRSQKALELILADEQV
ncbi:cytochrome P450 [Roridomyces roridus]|uniref:Cytochrome P450 n=1 Tax=Roridomyces roridus TaxID=1738132 RepID=A0AAD7BKY8_9AGAR|nr:cytochrome P450 [Roridomyces roridus]